MLQNKEQEKFGPMPPHVIRKKMIPLCSGPAWAAETVSAPVQQPAATDPCGMVNPLGLDAPGTWQRHFPGLFLSAGARSR